MNNKQKKCNKQVVKTSMVWHGERAPARQWVGRRPGGSSVDEEQ